LQIQFNSTLAMNAKIVGIQCKKADPKFLNSEFIFIFEVNLTGDNSVGMNDNRSGIIKIRVIRTQEDSTTAEIGYHILNSGLPEEWKPTFIELMQHGTFKTLLKLCTERFIAIVRESINLSTIETR